MYSQDKTGIALQIYHQCGSVTKTIRVPGYPARRSLYTWIGNEGIPGPLRKELTHVNTTGHPGNPSPEVKMDALHRCPEPGESIKSVSEETGYTGAGIYAWRKKYLRGGNRMPGWAVSGPEKGGHPLIHSDRGCHYRWPGRISRMEQAGPGRSMSKKGCSPDNSACEGLSGRLKNEMFYNRGRAGVSIREFIDILNEYLIWYNEKRIKISPGNMSPGEYRQSPRLVA